MVAEAKHAPSGALRVFLQIAIIAVICFLIEAAITGRFGFSNGREIGVAIGAIFAMAAFGWIIAAVVRLIRRKSMEPDAGLISGILAVVAYTALSCVGYLSHAATG